MNVDAGLDLRSAQETERCIEPAMPGTSAAFGDPKGLL
jgi:hypothetical protein